VARAAFLDIYERFAGVVLNVPLAYNPSSEVGPIEALAELQFRARLDPAGGSATVEFFLPRPETVRLTAVDVTGRQVAVLAEGPETAGWHQISWNLRDGEGRPLPSGVYFVKLMAGKEAPARKLVVIR
jgi:hypothetical protein